MSMAICNLGGLGSRGFRGGDSVQFVGSSTGEEWKTSVLTSISGNDTALFRISGWKSSVDRYDLEYANGAGDRDAKVHRNDWYSRGSWGRSMNRVASSQSTQRCSSRSNASLNSNSTIGRGGTVDASLRCIFVLKAPGTDFPSWCVALIVVMPESTGDHEDDICTTGWSRSRALRKSNLNFSLETIADRSASLISRSVLPFVSLRRCVSRQATYSSMISTAASSSLRKTSIGVLTNNTRLYVCVQKSSSSK